MQGGPARYHRLARGVKRSDPDPDISPPLPADQPSDPVSTWPARSSTGAPSSSSHGPGMSSDPPPQAEKTAEWSEVVDQIYPTSEDYAHWWANEYVLHSAWWPPVPLEPSRVLRHMKHRALERVPTAPILEPSTLIRQDKRFAELAANVMDQGGSSLHVRAAVRHEVERT